MLTEFPRRVMHRRVSNRHLKLMLHENPLFTGIYLNLRRRQRSLYLMPGRLIKL